MNYIAEDKKIVNIHKIFDILNLPQKSRMVILKKLTEAVGYNIYSRYQEKLSPANKNKFQYLVRNNNPEAFFDFLMTKTNKNEFQNIYLEESVRVIKQFVLLYIKGVKTSKREQILNKLEGLIN